MADKRALSGLFGGDDEYDNNVIRGLLGMAAGAFSPQANTAGQALGLGIQSGLGAVDQGRQRKLQEAQIKQQMARPVQMDPYKQTMEYDQQDGKYKNVGTFIEKPYGGLGRPASAIQSWDRYQQILREQGPEAAKQFYNLARPLGWLDTGPNFTRGPLPGEAPTEIVTKGLKPGEEPGIRARQAQGAETGKKIGEQDTNLYESVQTAFAQREKISDLLDHLKNSEAITGMGAEILKNIARAKKLIGWQVEAGKISDTEILDVMMGSEVFPLIKTLGVGARGMDTPQEREFMRKVLTGSIELNKDTLIRMAEIRDNVAKRVIEKWNERLKRGELDRFYEYTGYEKKPFDLGAIKPGASNDSSPRKITSDADYSELPSGAIFIGPDGVTRRKP